MVITENTRTVVVKDIDIDLGHEDEIAVIKEFCYELWRACEREPYDIGQVISAIAKELPTVTTHQGYNVMID